VWESSDVLNPHITVRQIEELAVRIATIVEIEITQGDKDEYTSSND